MSIVINIGGVDRTSVIDTTGFQLDRALTSQIDTLKFNITRKDSGDYKPAILEDVSVEEEGVLIFGGQIVETSSIVEGNPNIEVLQVSCKDYSYDMDKSLVISTYTNMTVEDIVADINTNFLTGYTVTNVIAPITIGFIAFNYEYPSKCFQQLAQLINYDWYVDPTKNIYFFSKEGITAPFNLTDTNGKYFTNSLKIKSDAKSIRNSIVVRGGVYEGDPITETFVADGNQITFTTAYQYSDVSLTVNGTPKTIGIDFITDPTTVDVLYNYNEKAFKFPIASKPTVSQVVAITGNPKIPVIVKVKDVTSVATYGEFQFKIIDKSITTKQGARDRATSEIIAWANTVNDGSFRTKEVGLAVGQQISVQSTIRGIDEVFVINKINSTLRSPTEFNHNVILMTKQTFGMIEFLQSLLISKDKEIEINQNEVVDEVESVFETVVIDEVFAASLIHNPQAETVTIGELQEVQALNYAVEFCAGPQARSGLKRQFVLEGSPLA